MNFLFRMWFQYFAPWSLLQNPRPFHMCKKKVRIWKFLHGCVFWKTHVTNSGSCIVLKSRVLQGSKLFTCENIFAHAPVKLRMWNGTQSHVNFRIRMCFKNFLVACVKIITHVKIPKTHVCFRKHMWRMLTWYSEYVFQLSTFVACGKYNDACVFD